MYTQITRSYHIVPTATGSTPAHSPTFDSAEIGVTRRDDLCGMAWHVELLRMGPSGTKPYTDSILFQHVTGNQASQEAEAIFSTAKLAFSQIETQQGQFFEETTRALSAHHYQLVPRNG